MSAFDLDGAVERARARLGSGRASRKKRSDTGALRLSPAVLAQLTDVFGGQERVPMAELARELRRRCQERGLRCPSRASLYKAMGKLVVHRFLVAELPASVAATLYNLDRDAQVPGHQLVFHCFNYGGSRAMSYAAGLPWLALYQAARMRGWRTMSRGPLLAVCRVRGI